MGFYGNQLAVANAAKTQFTFDRVYANRYTMDLNMADDGVYIGRYVLVEYGIDDELMGNVAYVKTGTSPLEFYTSPNFEEETRLLYSETTTENTSVTRGTIIQTPMIDGDGNPYKTFYICTGYDKAIYEVTKVQYAIFEKVVSSTSSNYTTNYNIDLAAYTDNNGGKGYDSTVWQKVYVNNEEKYINIADLNSVVPTFDVTYDAPTLVPMTPHFDSNSSNVYYKLHMQPQWGFRVRNSTPTEEESTDYSLQYDSDTYVQYYDRNYYDEVTDTEGKSFSYNGAIYFNKAGFNPEVRSYKKDLIDAITVKPTGKSGQSYNTHNDNPADTEKRVDTQELVMMLPSLGNTISELWDLAYGNEKATEGEKRNLNIEWDDTSGLRLIHDGPDGFTYSTDEVKSIAGCINSVHDLIGMIINNGQVPIDEALRDRIYYFDNKYWIKGTEYEYVKINNQDEVLGSQQYEPINLASFTEFPRYVLFNKDYYYTDSLGDISATFTLDLTPVVLDNELYEKNKYYYLQDNNFILETADAAREDVEYYSVAEKAVTNPEEKLYFHDTRSTNRYYEIIDDNGISIYKKTMEENHPQDGCRYFIITPTTGESYQYDEYGNLVPGTTLNVEDREEIYLTKFDTNKKYYSIEKDAETGLITKFIYVDGIENVDDSVVYYSLTTEKRNTFYEPHKYYYSTASGVGDDVKTTFFYGDEVKPQAGYNYFLLTSAKDRVNFYQPNAFYYQPDPENKPKVYEIDNKQEYTPNRQYYVRINLYVANDASGILPQYTTWNPYATEVPPGVELAKRLPYDTWIELQNFGRTMSTINGLIVRINRVMEFGNPRTRDDYTVMGCLNQMKDIIRKMAYLVPGQVNMVDNYGRVTSAPVDTTQTISFVNHLTGGSGTTGSFENAWIEAEINGNPQTPKITLKHSFNPLGNMDITTDLNAADASNVITLYSPTVDNTGHIVASNINKVTLPSSYSKFTDADSGSSEAGSMKDAIVLSGDSWIKPKVSQNSFQFSHSNPVTSSYTAVTNATPNFGETFTITDHFFDSKGHKFATSSHTVTIPTPSITDATSNGADVITALGFNTTDKKFKTTRTNIGALKLTGFESAVAQNSLLTSALTINEAFGTLEEKLVQEISDRTTAIENEIKKLDVTDTADTTKYVSGVSETDGKISVSRSEFSPSVAITNTENVVPSMTITVAGNKSSAQALPTASTTNYGVVQLTSTYSNLDATKAITGAGLSNAFGTLAVTDSAEATKYVSGVSQSNGKITVNRESFNPSVSISAENGAVPSIGITVAGNNATAVAFPTASTNAYGAAKLTSTFTSDDNTLAITGVGVQSALDTLSNKYVALETYNQLKSEYDAFKAKVESFLNEKYPAGEGEPGFAGWTTPTE